MAANLGVSLTFATLKKRNNYQLIMWIVQIQNYIE